MLRFTRHPQFASRFLRRKPLRTWRPCSGSRLSRPRFAASRSAEFIGFFAPMFRPRRPTKQFPCAMKPFCACGVDIRKQPTAIRLPTKRRRRRHGTGDCPCGPPASSSPAPSSWLVPRWRVLRIRICRASELSPIVGRRLRIRQSSRSCWRQSKRSGK